MTTYIKKTVNFTPVTLHNCTTDPETWKAPPSQKTNGLALNPVVQVDLSPFVIYVNTMLIN